MNDEVQKARNDLREFTSRLGIIAITREDGVRRTFCDAIEALIDAKIKEAQVVHNRIHGIDCPKVEHIGEGYLHAESDDDPYVVDEVTYCGRCHGWLG